MFIVGLILAILGYFLVIPVLETIGIILLVIGLVLWAAGGLGHPVAGRRYWY